MTTATAPQPGSGGLSRRSKIFIGVGALPAARHPARRAPRQRGQERGVPAAERVQARPLDPAQDRPARHEHQQGGALPVPRLGAHDRGAGCTSRTACRSGRTACRPPSRPLYQLMKNNITEGNMDRGWRRGGSRSIGTLFLFIWFSNLIGYLPLPDQHRAQGRHLRARVPVVRALRGDGEHLDPAGADAGGLVPLPLRGHPGEGLRRLPEGLGARRRRGRRGRTDLRHRGDLALRADHLALGATVRQHPRRPPADPVHGRRPRGAARARRARLCSRCPSRSRSSSSRWC